MQCNNAMIRKFLSLGGLASGNSNFTESSDLKIGARTIMGNKEVSYRQLLSTVLDFYTRL